VDITFIDDEKELIDKIVDYWDRQPCNINHSLKPIGTKQYFDENSEKRYFVEPHIKRLASFEKYKGKRILEIGCGIGADAVEFIKHGAEYVGLDLSKASVDIAKERLSVYNLKGKLHVHDASNSLEQFGKFDVVYSCGVIHHYPNARQIVSNIYDVLKNQGEFNFLVYAKNSWKYAMIQHNLDQFESQENCPYAKAYTKNSVKRLLKDKFDVTAIEQDHCFMYNVEKYKKGIYELEPWFASMSEEMRETIRKQLGWHLLVKSKKHEK
jgi:SAM-dependent methyltransferase